jgi:hypothetical protein
MSTHSNEFESNLNAAFETLLANRSDPWKAVELFEPILERLYYDVPLRDLYVGSVRVRGSDAFDTLSSSEGCVAMEVRHFCFDLQYLDDSRYPPCSLKDMFMRVITRFTKYTNHLTNTCQICRKYPTDLIHRADLDPAGRAHFAKWVNMARKKKDENNDEGHAL